MKEFTVLEDDAGQRLDKFVLKVTGNLSPSLMYKYIRKKDIKVNGKRSTADTRLSQGDRVTLYIKDEFFEKPSDDFLSIGYDPKLAIVYEDKNILLVDKKPGVVVHADESQSRDTLINQVLLYLYKKGEYDPKTQQSFRPALCNRLDKNTGGIVIVAKNAAAGRVMYEIIKNRQVIKKYLALVKGSMPKSKDTLTAYLIKNSSEKKVGIYDSPINGAKTIITKYRVLKEAKGMSLIEVELVTGRTHQIRAHLSHIGHPIFGDCKYGNSNNKNSRFKHQALYAYSLQFKLGGEQNILSYLDGKRFIVHDIYFENYI